MKNRIEFLFAHSAMSALKDVRGTRWRELVTRVAALPETHPDALAFQLMMVRLSGCISCDARRFRERGGCANCSRFVLTTLAKENEANLLSRYRSAQKEITHTLKSKSAEQVAA